jgi:hypothetical protein
MMAEQPKAPPGRKPDIGLSRNPISERNIKRPLELAAAGIHKNLAHRARKLARMKLGAFQRLEFYLVIPGWNHFGLWESPHGRELRFRNGSARAKVSRERSSRRHQARITRCRTLRGVLP